MFWSCSPPFLQLFPGQLLLPYPPNLDSIKKNPLKPICASQMFLNVRPPIGVRSTFQEQYSWRKLPLPLPVADSCLYSLILDLNLVASSLLHSGIWSGLAFAPVLCIMSCLLWCAASYPAICRRHFCLVVIHPLWFFPYLEPLFYSYPWDLVGRTVAYMFHLRLSILQYHVLYTLGSCRSLC